MGKVKVSNFKRRSWDGHTDQYQTSTRMATRQGVESIGGTVIEGTEVEIDETQLEPGEQWTPKNFTPPGTRDATVSQMSKDAILILEAMRTGRVLVGAINDYGRPFRLECGDGGARDNVKVAIVQELIAAGKIMAKADRGGGQREYAVAGVSLPNCVDG
jgi:hypothetical protein